MSDENPAKSLKSFSPEQIEEAISKALITLSGQQSVKVEINGIEFNSTAFTLNDPIHKFLDTTSFNIKIQSEYECKNTDYQEWMKNF